MGRGRRSRSVGKPPGRKAGAPDPIEKAGASNATPQTDVARTPLVINGWRIYLYSAFAERYAAAAAEVRRQCDADPKGYTSSPAAKFARVLHDLIVREIPANPASPAYRLGNTLGSDARTWRRAKFFGRFRLFFRYSAEQRTIVYAWLNDESTLRKAGASSDVYAVFRVLIERGTPPASWDALVAASDQAMAGQLGARPTT
jgi:toxin YhaV